MWQEPLAISSLAFYCCRLVVHNLPKYRDMCLNSVMLPICYYGLVVIRHDYLPNFRDVKVEKNCANNAKHCTYFPLKARAKKSVLVT